MGTQLVNMPGSPLPLLGSQAYSGIGRGNLFYVDPVNGNDGNDGTVPFNAKKTLGSAFAQCVADQNDTIALIGEVSAGGLLTAQLLWNKNATHLVGLSAPTFLNQRSRLSFGTGVISPGIIVSASGCIFKNLYIPYGTGQATNLIALQVTGNRNYFEGVSLIWGNATEAGTAATMLLDCSGGVENTFRRCTFGTTTETLSAANWLVYLEAAAGRLLFDECTFLSRIASATTPLHVKVATANNSLTDFAIFRKCSFLNYSINQAAKLAQAVAGGATAGGVILLQNCGFMGFTAVTTTNTAQVGIIGAEAVTAANQGLAVAP